MITLRGRANAPCVICQKEGKTANVKFKDGSFDGVMCMDHLYERLKPYNKKSNGTPNPKRGGKDAATEVK